MVEQRCRTRPRQFSPHPQSRFTIGALFVLAALVATGIYLGAVGRARAPLRSQEPGRNRAGDQDALSSVSAAHDSAAHTPAQSMADRNPDAMKSSLTAQEQTGAAARQQADIDAAKRDLALKAAEQAANERRLADEQAHLEAEKQRAADALAEAEKQRDAAEAQRQAAAAAERARQQAEQQLKTRVYQGPGSGQIVWRGEVHGTTLVTIDGSSSDAGEVLSGGLPGVLVMVQPMDGKHVGVAGSPAPSNGFRRLVLRIQGNGNVQEVIHWSIP